MGGCRGRGGEGGQGACRADKVWGNMRGEEDHEGAGGAPMLCTHPPLSSTLPLSLYFSLHLSKEKEKKEKVGEVRGRGGHPRS